MHSLKFVIASNNAHKVSEIRAMIPAGFSLMSLKDAGITEELPETTGTIPGNAFQKADYVHKHTRLNSLADDSGLLVAALNDAPGVDSAFYAGHPRSDENNIRKLLNDLKGVSDRKASFQCVLALVVEGKSYTFEGRLTGTIAESPSGTNGFGYDPVFIPEGYTQTLAELGAAEKNKISHRAKALQKLIAFLQNYNSLSDNQKEIPFR